MTESTENKSGLAAAAGDESSSSPPIPWAWIKRLRDLIDHPPPPTATSHSPLPVQILPWLYLSDETNARRASHLSNLNITHVLSLNTMPDAMVQDMADLYQSRGIVHRYSPGQDEEDYDMIGNHWEECCAFLQEARNNAAAGGGSGVVLVHCHAGINRSGLIVAAAYMVLERRPVLEVVEDILGKRQYFLWNGSFQAQLCHLAARKGLLGKKPEAGRYSDDPIVTHPLPPPPTTGKGPYT